VIVLVDTGVWVEYFRRRPRLAGAALDQLEELLRDDLAAVILPIRAELLSGRLKREHTADVRAALAGLRHLDLDWNAADTWEALARMAQDARSAGAPTAGLVDRMVLLAAERAGAALWTLDTSLTQLASSRGTSVWDGAVKQSPGR